jgi:hypothetical protein
LNSGNKEHNVGENGEIIPGNNPVYVMTDASREENDGEMQFAEGGIMGMEKSQTKKRLLDDARGS